MTLVEKLVNIAKTSTVKSLKEYPDVEKAKDFDELWDKVIEPNLPSKDTVEKWHNLLMKYIEYFSPEEIKRIVPYSIKANG